MDKATQKPAGKHKFFRREDLALYIMAAPTVIFLLIFCYAPMLGLVMAFQNYNVTAGIFGSPFCGLANFKYLFSTTDAFIITRNTVCYNLVFIVTNMLLSVLMALMLSELTARRYAKTLQTIYMLPHFLSWAVVSIVLIAFLDKSYGLVNQWLGVSVDWYKRKSIWPGLLVFINAWKGVGYSTVLYLAVISGISQEYYEAAIIDGATKFQQALYITIPHLRMVMAITLIMSMGSIFRGDFGLFYSVTKNSGRLYEVTDVIDTYVYRALTQLSNVGMSTAAGMYQSVCGFVLVLITNWIVTKIDAESAMF
ncbi:MAG: ABC transporter permease [Christensenellales bacterium]